jgi:hypothetical protein
MSELAIAWPRFPAPKRAMLCCPAVRRIFLDQGLDVVADPALAELPESGEVSTDLRRVDVGVVRELLRGDRVLAHLAGLSEHLEIAGEPSGDAQ